MSKRSPSPSNTLTTPTSSHRTPRRSYPSTSASTIILSTWYMINSHPMVWSTAKGRWSLKRWRLTLKPTWLTALSDLPSRPLVLRYCLSARKTVAFDYASIIEVSITWHQESVPVAFGWRVARPPRPCQALHRAGSDERVSSNSNSRR